MNQIVTGLLLAMLFFSCKKGNVNSGDLPDPISGTPLKTAIGVPQGDAVTKKIGAAGGSIASADGRMRIDIPEGALSGEQTLSIQPITNTLDFATSAAYRLLPKDLAFQRPATVTFTYTEAEIKSTLAEGLGVAGQTADGSWAVLPKKQLNKAQKKVSASFSKAVDLTFFPLCYIKPYDARVKTGEKIQLAILATLPEGMEKYPEVDGSYITGPYPLNPGLVGDWSYSGKGHLTSGGATAEYTAPAQVPSPNPEAVSVKLKLSLPGVFQLISNITVLGEQHIDYLQVDETEMDAGTASYPSRLYIHGNFGNDPGIGKRSVKINGYNLNVVLWTPNLILCDLLASGPNASGPVVVSCDAFTDTKLLNEWLITLEYMKVESPDAALTRRFDLNVRLRGDADGFFKAGQHSLFSYTDININSSGVVNMPAGTFSTHTEADGCADHKVNWDKLENVAVGRIRHESYDPGVSGEVVHAPDGFKVKLRFNSGNILRCTRIETPCGSPARTNIVMEPILLAGYEDAEIHFQFSGVGQHASIMAGSMPELKRTGVASGLYFDQSQLNPDLFYTRMSWKVAQPKW
ncbi:hypothetical protein Q4E93_32245 [Flavitalea sp. BT771]|uniref:hypothetical protein n=1 Tax=Flavitalea sp. BT771 TaxID=3063329 RepID=UPI0026E2C06E|nr:hypothetical protein [Flavitalea sp. BT771]MDO6435331.1 hypothetical protein [Flavitalea sp. BT771]MDV6224309.1 hypothetical protein [Flavitalea sp. BT771]